MMQPPPAPVFSMNHSFSFPPVGIGEETQPTQLQTQESEADDELTAVNRDLWGYLIPCNSALQRVEFHKDKNTYLLGRHPHQNDIPLPGHKISNKHCTIKWNGLSDHKSEVLVHDTSSNGTFVNGVRIGKGKDKALGQGDEIGFGTGAQASPEDDFRYIYRHQGLNVPLTGVFIDYDVRGELGKGSFATVLRATHRATGQVFAVKLINTKRFALSANQSTAKMFIREIEILLELHHPNIVSLRQIFEDSSSIALVMEYIRGGDLLDFILRRGGISEHETAHLTRQMCEAMSYIHSKGIAHRDLKPENVLLTDTNPVIVKIADFGLAKAVDSGTFLKTMCGTPSYLAPEVVSQGEPGHSYNHLVDSWSMGVIVFSMLTNTSPFLEEDEGNPTASLSTRIQNRSVEWAFLAPARVTQTCYDFIRRLLTNDPKARMSLTEALGHPWLLNIDYNPSDYPLHALPTGLGEWEGASGLVKGLRQGYGVGGGNGMGERHTNGTGPSGFTNGAAGAGMLPRPEPSQRSTVSPPPSSPRSSVLLAPYESADAISPPPHHTADHTPIDASSSAAGSITAITMALASEGMSGGPGIAAASLPVSANNTLDMRHGFQNLQLRPDGSVAGAGGGDVSMNLSEPSLSQFPRPPADERPTSSNGRQLSSGPVAVPSLQIAGPPGTRNGKRIGKQLIFNDVIPDSQPPAPPGAESHATPPPGTSTLDQSWAVVDPSRAGGEDGDHPLTPQADGEEGFVNVTSDRKTDDCDASQPPPSLALTTSTSSISTFIPLSSDYTANLSSSNVSAAPPPPTTSSNERKRKAAPSDASSSGLSSPPPEVEVAPGPSAGAKGKGKARGKPGGTSAKARATSTSKKAPAKGKAAVVRKGITAKDGDAEEGVQGEGSVPVRRSSRRQAPFKSQRIS